MSVLSGSADLAQLRKDWRHLNLRLLLQLPKLRCNFGLEYRSSLEYRNLISEEIKRRYAAFMAWQSAARAVGDAAADAARADCLAARSEGRALPALQAVLVPENEPEHRYHIRYRVCSKDRDAPVQVICAGPSEADARAEAARIEAWGGHLVQPAASLSDPTAARCRLCGAPFGDDEDGGEVARRSLRNAGVLDDACEPCAAEFEEDSPD